MFQLSSSQIEQFLAEGHIVLRGCFSRAAAQPLVDEAWQLLGYDPADSSTWAKPLAFLFPTTSTRFSGFAPALWSAIGELSGGLDRLAYQDTGIGQWVINFSLGRNEPWRDPKQSIKGWHVDGNFFRHFLDSPEQGLLVVPLFSDVLPRGGGTIFAADSIPVISRFLNEHPEGILPSEFPYRDLLNQCNDIRELTGEVGDCVIFHPFMLHSFGQNHQPTARFITNSCVSLKEPMRFDQPKAETSWVERSILNGLGLDRLKFEIQGERERVAA